MPVAARLATPAQGRILNDGVACSQTGNVEGFTGGQQSDAACGDLRRERGQRLVAVARQQQFTVDFVRTDDDIMAAA